MYAFCLQAKLFSFNLIVSLEEVLQDYESSKFIHLQGRIIIKNLNTVFYSLLCLVSYRSPQRGELCCCWKILYEASYERHEDENDNKFVIFDFQFLSLPCRFMLLFIFKEGSESSSVDVILSRPHRFLSLFFGLLSHVVAIKTQ